MFLAQNRYKVLSGHEALHFVEECLKKDGLKLTREQWNCLYDRFGNSGILGNLDMDVQFYTWKKQKEKGKSIWWRLTLPFHLIWAFIVNFIICPVHWVFKGKWSLGNDSRILKFSYAWYDKIFDWRDERK